MYTFRDVAPAEEVPQPQFADDRVAETGPMSGLRLRAVPLLLALGLWCSGGVLAAAETDPREADEPAAAVPPGGERPVIERIDEEHARQEVMFGKFCQSIDKVFGEEYVEDRERKAQLRAGGGTTFNDDGESTATLLKFALRLPLPALERRLNVFLDVGEDIENLGDAANPNFADADRNLSIAAGLLGRLREEVEGGFKVTLFWYGDSFASVYPFLRFERLRAPLRYFLEQRLIWESDGSWNTRTDFDVDRTLRSGMFLRFRNRADYRIGDSGAQLAHALILRQRVFETGGLSYELWLEYNTSADDPGTLADDTITYAQVRWRGRVWRPWLEYELRPAYTVPMGDNRDSFFSFFVSLTVIWDSRLGGGLADPPEAIW